MSEVYRFLSNLGLEHYYNNFVYNGYNTIDLLYRLDYNALESLGIYKEHQTIILESLRQNSKNPMAISNILESPTIKRTTSYPQEYLPTVQKFPGTKTYPPPLVNRHSDVQLYPMNNTTSTSQFFRPPNFPQNNYDATWINSSVSEEKGAFDSKYYQNSASSDSHNKKQGGSSPLMGNETEISKRKYRRHPKTDPNAPAKPQTAYIKFSSSVRESGKFKQLSFTESAKVVAKLWKDLDQSTKNYFLQEAHKDRIRYREEMAVYRTSSSYREYRAYLTEFYGQGGQIVRSVGRPAKLSTPELHKNMFQ